MTATAILDELAKEFSAKPEEIHRILELLDAGLTAPYVARVRRREVGGLSEHLVRRVDLRRREYEELDRRRGTILRLLEGQEEIAAKTLDDVRSCMDRFELEDLFVPHRRAEPEVQLALDRGLGGLADRLVEPAPAPEEDGAAKATEGGDDAAPESSESTDPVEPAGADSTGASPTGAEATAEEAPASESGAESPSADASTDGSTDGSMRETPAAEPQSGAPETAKSEASEPGGAASDGAATGPASQENAESAALHGSVELTPALARLCAEFVRPDRGVHTEEEALAGAMRILSDRLGRNSRLRGTLRGMMRKQGVLSVRPTVDESKLGRHKSLLKIRQPLKQVQGHRLLAMRQAQKERVLNTSIRLDPGKALPKVRAALGKRTRPECEGVLETVALRALERRLLPMLEEDVRLELKERADQEALRFLAQHLRQVLLAPYGGHRPAAGVDVNAKGDWTIVVVDERGESTSEEIRIETGEKRAADLGLELSKVLGDTGVRALAVGHGKHAKTALEKLRQAIAAIGGDAVVFIVNEAGLSSYANSELARKELPDRTVPGRMAVSLARRFQDPLAEIVKVDPRHLGLGLEQGLVSKANLRRVLTDTVESCVALVGCDVNRASETQLRCLPGVSAELAARIVGRRAERPFASREELRSEGIMSESEWTSAISFLRVPGSSEPLDATSLHPDQYVDARRVIEAGGGSVEDTLGKRGATKGLRRVDFDLDEDTWRDLMREIAAPGRDPRLRLLPPRLLDPQTRAEDLEAGREVEGVVSNVASFGAFVDLGIGKEGMIHISEISDRYVRDAREMLSIGQVVRGRVIDPSGQRVSVSLKGVEDPLLRGPRGGRGGAPRSGSREDGGGRGRGRRPREEKRETWPTQAANVRAAQSRRDGMAGAGSPGRGGRKGGGGRPGGGPGRGGGGRGRGPRDRDEGLDRKALREVNQGPAYNPFASFFKGGDEGPEAPKQEGPAQDSPKQEVPKQETPKQEAPKQEAPKQETTAGASAPQESEVRRAPASSAGSEGAPAQDVSESETTT